MSEHIYFFDTTLRDGEQSPGATMNTREKVRLARQLESLGVDVIEAGFPASSPGDFEAVREIAGSVSVCQVAALCRAMPADIDRAWEAIKESPQGRIHTFVATSDIHMRYKLRKSPEEVLEMAEAAVRHAAAKTSNVEFSAEDASRSDRCFLAKVFSRAIAAGATTINVPDTVGYAQPQEFAELIAWLREHVEGMHKAVLSVHCHNDLGLASANTLAAVKAGARQIEVTLSGIGERAGNTPLEEAAMSLNVRKDFFQVESNIKTELLFPSARLLSLIIGQPIPPYKPITGANAFAHESGIHQDGMLKNRETYEIMTPASVGRVDEELVLGKHSGRAALDRQLKTLGYRLEENQLALVFEAMKKLADRKKEIFVEDLEAVVLDEVFRIPDKYRLEYLSALSGNMAIPNAVVKLWVDGEERMLSDFGTGPVDAVFNTLSKAVGCQPKLLRYAVNAVTGGTDAQGEVTVNIEKNGKTAMGRGSDADIIVASAKAYLNALNHLAKRTEENVCAKR